MIAGAVVLVALGGPSSLGIELCWLRRITGLPCPGCGMTRAVCHLVQGHWTEAIGLHPFSLLVVPWALLTLISPLWAESSRIRLRRRLERHRRGFAIVYGSLVGAFVVFGFLRALSVVAGLATFP